MNKIPIGYINQNDPTPIYELSKEQLDFNKKITDLLDKIKLGQEAQLLLNKLQSNCKHLVFIDINGEPYDSRFCIICKKDMGWI